MAILVDHDTTLSVASVNLPQDIQATTGLSSTGQADTFGTMTYTLGPANDVYFEVAGGLVKTQTSDVFKVRVPPGTDHVETLKLRRGAGTQESPVPIGTVVVETDAGGNAVGAPQPAGTPMLVVT